MATVSYLYTASTEGSSADLSGLIDGILKFSVTGSVATPATAIASTTDADNDYVAGSAALTNIGTLPALAGSMIIGTGDSTYWIELPVSAAGSVMYLNQTSEFANIVPSWISPGEIDQVLTVIGDTVGQPRLGWTTPSPGFTWVSVSGTSQDLAANTGYFANNVDPTTFTLPVSATVGDTYEVVGPALWIIAQNVGQSIIFGDNSIIGGTLSSTQAGDTVRLVCSNATPGSEVFRVLSAIGELTVF